MADEPIRPLDATDITQVIEVVRDWINGLKDPETEQPILDSHLWLEYVEDPNGFGYCIKSDGGDVLEEDVVGGFSAEITFMIYRTVNAVPEAAGAITQPLNDLSAWFRANGTAGLDIGARRTPDELITLKGPTDLSGKDEDGNTTFFSVFSLTYDEEAL